MTFFDILQGLCCSRQITPTEMAKSIGISTAMPTNWKNGQIPNGETLIKLSDFFHVSIDYLLGREETKKEPRVIPNDGLNPKVQKVIRLLETKDIPDDVVDFIYKALENYKK